MSLGVLYFGCDFETAVLSNTAQSRAYMRYQLGLFEPI